MPENMNVGEKPKMSPEELARSRRDADIVNQKNKELGKKYGEQMGKDSFLKLLVTELTHQDPTQPMQDREFIAQMAQFSSLEQMSNMNTQMKSLTMNAKSSEAYNLLGKKVQGLDPETGYTVEGTVSHIVRDGEETYLAVGATKLRLEDINAIFPQAQEAVANQTVANDNMQSQTKQQNPIPQDTAHLYSDVLVEENDAVISPKGAYNSIKNYEFYYDINTKQKEAAQSYSAQ